jgi:TRAP-type mannitol/chloroaromatic compound transport system permease small subunit
MKRQVFTKTCDQISEWSGRCVAWLIWVVVGLCVYEIVTRRFFNSPHVWTYDVTSVFYGSHFMLLTAYTLLHRGHVSIDILYSRLLPRTQAILDVVNYLVFFFPFMIVLLYVGMDSAIYSWSYLERTTAGLPLVYPILKTVTPATAFLLLIQGLSDLMKRLLPEPQRAGSR